MRGNPGSSILGSLESAGSEGVWLDADDGQTPTAAAGVHADLWSPMSILQGPNGSNSICQTPTVRIHRLFLQIEIMLQQLSLNMLIF